MLVKDIVEIMEKYFPLSKQEEWDKCGLQIGDLNQEVKKIMIGLNADQQTLLEAIDQDCDMLITHHPFLLDPIENIDSSHFMGQFIYSAIKNDVAIYSSHTAMDHVLMNHWLIEMLDVEDIQVGDDSGISRIARLKEPMTQNDFIQHIKDVYQLDHFKYAGNKELISVVALIGGSGADFLPHFYNKADAFITGDSKYRHAKNAVDHDILLVDVNHHIENIMVKRLKELLEKEVNIEIVEASSKDYYHYI